MTGYALQTVSHEGHTKKKKRRAVYYFEATQKALHICRYYNPSATIQSKTTL